jgi:hypothetical protein
MLGGAIKAAKLAKQGAGLIKRPGASKALKPKPTAKKAVDKELAQGEFEFPPEMAKLKDKSTDEMLENFFAIISGKKKLSPQRERAYKQTIDKITKD